MIKIMKKINKEVLYEILQYLIVLMIILECNSIYSQLYGYHLIIRATITVLAILCLAILIMLKQIKIHKQISKPIVAFIIYDVLCSVIMFINTDSFSGKGIIILVFLMFLPLLQIYLSNLKEEDFKNLLQKFVDIVIILSVISLIFWVLTALFKVLTPTSVVKVLWGKPYSLIKSYFNLHFDTQDVWWITGAPLIRNTGIFTEGPMYALILVVALVFNNLLLSENTKSNFIRTMILSITIFSTISVTGIICLIIILGYNTIKYILSMDKLNKKIFSIILITIIIVMLPLGFSLVSKKMNTGSAAHRNMDIQIGLKTFLENPLIGHGINHERATEIDYEVGYGYSNTIIPVLTDGGLILSIMYILPIVLMINQCIKNRKINYIIFSLIFIIILFTTLIQYRLVMILLISVAYLFSCSNYLKEREI